jgi:hypothetical protein
MKFEKKLTIVELKVGSSRYLVESEWNKITLVALSPCRSVDYSLATMLRPLRSIARPHCFPLLAGNIQTGVTRTL